MGSRFDNWSRGPAIVVLAVVGALMVLGIVIGGSSRVAGPEVEDDATDSALYEAISQRVSDGENYYDAAVAEQIPRNYPVRPATTIRQPTLAYATAAVGGPANLRVVLIVAGIGVALLMAWRLERIASGRVSWWAATVLTGLAGMVLFEPSFVVIHEAWAGLFIIFSLITWSRKRYLPSVILGFLAVATREIALPYLLLMAFFAWREGRLKEIRAWLVAVVVFAAGYAAHLAIAASHTSPGDPQQSGWLTFGGWQFALDTARSPSALSFGPWWLAAVIVPLAVLGWASRTGDFASRVTVLLIGYLVTFTIVGRPDNWYWGILYVTFLGAGVAFAPGAVVALVRRALGAKKSAVSA